LPPGSWTSSTDGAFATAGSRRGSSDVPAAFALFPKDISQPPREWAERFFNVQRWTQMHRGGHFAAMEEPELLVDDIRAFFRPLRSEAAATSESAQATG